MTLDELKALVVSEFRAEIELRGIDVAAYVHGTEDNHGIDDRDIQDFNTDTGLQFTNPQQLIDHSRRVMFELSSWDEDQDFEFHGSTVTTFEETHATTIQDIRQYLDREDAHRVYEEALVRAAAPGIEEGIHYCRLANYDTGGCNAYYLSVLTNRQTDELVGWMWWNC